MFMLRRELRWGLASVSTESWAVPYVVASTFRLGINQAPSPIYHLVYVSVVSREQAPRSQSLTWNTAKWDALKR